MSFKEFISDFFELLYPRLCLVCGNNLLKQEKFLCLECIHHMPKTNFHLLDENPVAEIFYGRVNLLAATSFFHFEKGSKYRKLIHFLKYKNMPEVGEYLGSLYANELQNSSVYSTVDVICPVPLHPKKCKKRGYNQSEAIAKGIADRLEKDLSVDNLKRIKFTDTQTRKGRYERWENVEGIFKLDHPQEFEDKHILLVDDVLTTGSTLEACASAIFEGAVNTKISVVTLGYA